MTEQRLIDANALPMYKVKIVHAFGIVEGSVVFHDDIKNATTIDAVPVVRCKDCKYYVPHTDYTWCANTMRCNHPKLTYDIECYDHWLDVGPEDFCSRGERRDGGAVDGI